MVPRGAKRRVGNAGKDDDAHQRAHCAAEAAVLCVGIDLPVVNALESTDMGELVVKRGCAEEGRAPMPGPRQAVATKACAVPRIVSRERRGRLPRTDSEWAHYGSIRHGGRLAVRTMTEPPALKKFRLGRVVMR